MNEVQHFRIMALVLPGDFLLIILDWKWFLFSSKSFERKQKIRKWKSSWWSQVYDTTTYDVHFCNLIHLKNVYFFPFSISLYQCCVYQIWSLVVNAWWYRMNSPDEIVIAIFHFTNFPFSLFNAKEKTTQQKQAFDNSVMKLVYMVKWYA